MADSKKKEFKCNLCEKSSSSKRGLIQHKYRDHSVKEEPGNGAGNSGSIGASVANPLESFKKLRQEAYDDELIQKGAPKLLEARANLATSFANSTGAMADVLGEVRRVLMDNAEKDKKIAKLEAQVAYLKSKLKQDSSDADDLEADVDAEDLDEKDVDGDDSDGEIMDEEGVDEEDVDEEDVDGDDSDGEIMDEEGVDEEGEDVEEARSNDETTEMETDD